MLWHGSVLKLIIDDDFEALFVEACLFVKLQSFKDAWKLNERKSRSARVQTSRLGVVTKGSCMWIIPNRN